jgi:hypothetical protein
MPQLLSLQNCVVEIARDFQCYQYRGDDGYPTAAVASVVYVTTPAGVSYILHNLRQVRDDEDGIMSYVSRYEAEVMLARVIARGAIDLDHWVELEAEPTLEERFAEAAEVERVDRQAYGAPAFV